MRGVIAPGCGLAVLLALPACYRERIPLEPTEEGKVILSSSVKMADSNSAMQLVRGFHGVEQRSWRWTMGRFAVTLRPPDNAAKAGARLVVDFVAPESEIKAVGGTTLTALYRGQKLGATTCDKPGPYTLFARVPGSALQTEAAIFDFELDKYLKPSTTDGRELGVIVRSIYLEPL